MKIYADCAKTWQSFNRHCEFEGCLYNRDGFCFYNYSPIKMSFARACYDEFYDSMEDFYE